MRQQNTTNKFLSRFMRCGLHDGDTFLNLSVTQGEIRAVLGLRVEKK